MSQAAQVRAVAAQVLQKVLPLGNRKEEPLRALNDLLPTAQERLPEAERKLIQEICYGVCRWFTRLDKIASQLLEHPLKARDEDLHALLLIGLYQLFYMRIADHAAISETVEACRQLGKPWSVKLVNGVLRRAQREKSALEAAIPPSEALDTAHPQWLIDALKAAWPEQYRGILQANNQQAPLTLRVNLRRVSREHYMAALRERNIAASLCDLSPSGIRLERSHAVPLLPGYDDGWFSVQDEAAQLAAVLLAPQTGDRVLDACAAPGGKTTHLLELADIHCVAIDVDAHRCERIKENLERLGLTAEVCAVGLEDYASGLLTTATEGDTPSAPEPEPVLLFDRILLDVPCSATGIIRRHPDIKWLRRRTDINPLAEHQLLLLQTAFRLLKHGGTLLYATCSVLPQENERVILKFLKETPEACLQPLALNGGLSTPAGRQLFPAVNGHDGFFYARLSRGNPEATPALTAGEETVASPSPAATSAVSAYPGAADIGLLV